jgi:hypothetical protein
MDSSKTGWKFKKFLSPNRGHSNYRTYIFRHSLIKHNMPTVLLIILLLHEALWGMSTLKRFCVHFAFRLLIRVALSDVTFSYKKVHVAQYQIFCRSDQTNASNIMIWIVTESVTKSIDWKVISVNLLSRAPPCFRMHVKLLVPADFAIVSTRSSFKEGWRQAGGRW